MVGYKQPPLHSRFKKGQSGNSKGRPKKVAVAPEGAPSANRLALQEAERPVKVREGDDVHEIPTIEAVLRAQTKSAISGNAFAQRDLLNRYEKAEAERRLRIADDCAFWRRYIDVRHAQMAEAEAKGEPPPKMLPHPDDIIIDDIKGVSICGPGTEEEAAAVEKTQKIRDLLVMQNVFDERMRKGAKNNPTKARFSLVIAYLINAELPKRFRISDDTFVIRQKEYEVLTNRTLAKNLYQGWRDVGIPIHRGCVFPLVNASQFVIANNFKKGRGINTTTVADSLQFVRQGAMIRRL